MVLIKGKKGIMGIGTLIILISMILVSAVASGVVINSASSLQSKAKIVANVVEERLVTGIETISLTGYANAETMYGFEILARLKPASSPINLNDVSIVLALENVTLSPSYENLEPCSFGGLTEETQFCSEILVGNNDTILTPEELIYIRFKVSDANSLSTNDIIRLSVVTPKGEIEEMKRPIPSLVGTSRVDIV